MWKLNIRFSRYKVYQDNERVYLYAKLEEDLNYKNFKFMKV